MLQDRLKTILQLPVVFGNAVVVDGITNITPPANVPRSDRVIGCTIFGREDLVVEVACAIATPIRIAEGLTTDREFNRIQLCIEVGVNKPIRRVLVPPENTRVI